MKRAVRTRVVAIALVVLLYPVQALAGVCFHVAAFSESLTLDVDVIGPGELQHEAFALVGRLAGWCGSTATPAPVYGKAYVSPGLVDVGLTIGSVRANCIPGFLEATISLVTFTGTGSIVNFFGSFSAGTFTPISCPEPLQRQ